MIDNFKDRALNEKHLKSQTSVNVVSLLLLSYPLEVDVLKSFQEPLEMIGEHVS